jgi:hypothetical protein
MGGYGCVYGIGGIGGIIDVAGEYIPGGTFAPGKFGIGAIDVIG